MCINIYESAEKALLFISRVYKCLQSSVIDCEASAICRGRSREVKVTGSGLEGHCRQISLLMGQ